MTTRMENRTKGYIGTIVDGAKLAQIANAIYALQYPQDQLIECTVDDFLFVELAEKDSFEGHKGAIICDEGVGWEQDAYSTIQVPTNLGFLNRYAGRVHISVAVIRSCLTDKQVDIAEYVRVFGDRLDNNVAIWQSAMKK